MKNLKRQDRNGTRTTSDIERKYKLGQIDYTAEEIERLKMELTVDSSLSASSSNAVANSVITQALNNKVNKETGKGLSTNDFTDELLDKLNNMESIGGGGDTLPIGAVIEWDSDTIPENWLLLDGQAVSRTEYSELFKLYGTRYGAGDGSTTFNLPNRKTRVSVGKDSNDSDFNTLGKTGGEKTHKLEVYEIPSHRHNLANANENGADLTFTPVLLGNMNKGWEGSAFTSYEGGGAAHNNLQPYFVTNFIVKAKQSAGVIANVVDNLTSESSTDALSAKQGNILNEKIAGTVLYEDATGITGRSSLTLAQDISSYKRLKITYDVCEVSADKYIYGRVEEVDVTGNLTNLCLSTATKNIQYATLSISNTELSITRNRQSINGTTTEGDFIYITKVVGYE